MNGIYEKIGCLFLQQQQSVAITLFIDEPTQSYFYQNYQMKQCAQIIRFLSFLLFYSDIYEFCTVPLWIPYLNGKCVFEISLFAL